MKASKLVKELQKCIVAHGDTDVIITNSSNYKEITHLEWDDNWLDDMGRIALCNQ